MISGKPKMTHVHNFHPHDHVSPRSCAILALFTMSLTTTLAMADTTNSTQVPIVPDRMCPFRISRLVSSRIRSAGTSELTSSWGRMFP